MAKAGSQEAMNPLILRFHRLMDAFAKADDERDFYLDKIEGFILFFDLDKNQEELDLLQKELEKNAERYYLLPKITFYESKKFMEGFVNEKVYDIDTKEKLLDIIGSKESKENFLEFIYDHLAELEKWQQFYVERSRIRIIEWLRSHGIKFVFEEDLDLARSVVEKAKKHLFDAKVPKDVASARDIIEAKAKTYYSNEALNPRPKRGRPPKQVAKVELEPQMSSDIYMTIPAEVRHFLYVPDITSVNQVAFSSRRTQEDFLAGLRGSSRVKVNEKLQALSERLESLRHISSRLAGLKDLGLESEEKIIHAAIRAEEPQPEGEKKSIMKVFKGFMPKKKEKEEKEEKPAARPTTKVVAHIKQKRGKS